MVSSRGWNCRLLWDIKRNWKSIKYFF